MESQYYGNYQMFNKELKESIRLLKMENEELFERTVRFQKEIENLKGQIASNHYDFIKFAVAAGYTRVPDTVVKGGWKKIEAS